MKIIDQGIVYDATHAPLFRRFACFTAAILTRDQTLLVSFRTGSSKDAADENIMVMSSTDQGKTWECVKEAFEPPVPGYPTGFRYGGLTEIAPGNLLGYFQWFDRSDPSKPLANPETQGVLESRVFVANSHDNGRSWGSYREVSLRPHLGTAATGPVEVLHNGNLLLHYEKWKEWDDHSRGTHAASGVISTDGGQSWSAPVVIANDPAGQLLFWDQRLSASPDDGRIVDMFWTHNRDAGQDVDIHIGWGSPDGQQWTQPVSTRIAGQISAPLALPGNRVLAAYVHRHDPPSLRAVLSEDFGKTWRIDEELVFYDSHSGREAGMQGKRDFGDYWADMSVWSFGHPAPLALPNGDVFIAFYAGDVKSLGVHWVRIRL